jgi:hypothetical protein
MARSGHAVALSGIPSLIVTMLPKDTAYRYFKIGILHLSIGEARNGGISAMCGRRGWQNAGSPMDDHSAEIID